MPLSKCVVCGSKKSRFIKKQEASKFLSSLGIRRPLWYSDIVNKILLAGDKIMPEMHLRQPRFTYSACGPFTKNKERIQKFIETGD